MTKKSIIHWLLVVFGVAMVTTAHRPSSAPDTNDHHHHHDPVMMNDTIAGMIDHMLGTEPVEEFPTLHPLIVHFPIVLLVFAPLLQLCHFSRWRIPINLITLGTLTIGVFGAVVASFFVHPHTTPEIPAEAQRILEEHEFYAYATVALAGLALLIKAPLTLLAKNIIWVEVLILILLIGAAISVSIAGHHGAELVHKFGIGPKGNFLDLHHHH